MSIHALALLQAAAIAAATPESVDVESVLLGKLREQYPAVTRWEVHPFAGAVASGSGAISVARLGSRSAVRVGDRVYWYAVAGYQMGLSAARSIRTGESLDPSSARREEVDAMAVACTPVTEPSRLAGARARRALRPDQAICEEFLEPRPPVARGDDVVVRYVGTSLSLITKAVAEADGAMGESVQVRKINTTDRYLAVVSGVREVTINE